MIYFKHIEKTAGTSFKTLLRSNYGVFVVEANKVKKEVFNQEDFEFASQVFFKIKAISGHNLPPPTELNIKDQIPVTFLRNPVARCVSHYQDRVLRNSLTLNFEEWIGMPENQNFMVQAISGSNDLSKAKSILKNDYFFVGITERFEESIRLLKNQFDEPLKLYYNRRITASSNEIKNKILADESSLALLNKYNALDLELYNYAMEEIYLPCLARYQDKIDTIEVNSNNFHFRQKVKHKSSVAYNKYIYRPLIKIFRKKGKEKAARY